MNGDDLRLAPAGASDAACAVCLHMTLQRIVIGDGLVPICSTFCLQAWPRVRDLLADRDEWRRQHENALASWQADMRALDAAKSDAVRRAESAEMGCEIAYRREPTQAEGDSHEAGEPAHAQGECFVAKAKWAGDK